MMLFFEAQILHSTFLFDLSNFDVLLIISSRFIFGNLFFIPQFHYFLSIMIISLQQDQFTFMEQLVEV